jgi:hypothetical protein
MTAQRSATEKDTVLVCEGITAREFDGEWIVLDLRGGNYFGLNELGGAIWRHLGAGRTPTEIVRIVAQDYEVAETVILQDVLQMIDELVRRGLVRILE